MVKQPGRISRNTPPDAFIYVFDNVLEDGELSGVWKGQQVRSKKEFESIFVEAGLIIHKLSELEEMPAPFRRVSVWALF